MTKESQKFVCTSCGYVGYPKKIAQGSILIEIVLWLFLIIPGLVYSLWRLTSKQDACPKCKKPTMIPVDSPMGQRLVTDEPKS